jgi:hypothetical protein
MLSDVLVFALVSLIAGLVVSLLRMLVIAPGSPSVTDPLETAIGIAIGLAVYLVPVLVTGTTIGESAVLLRATGGWKPTVLARLTRAALGLAGVIVLSELIPVVGDVLSIALAIAIVVTLFIDRDRRGLAARAAGQHVVDAREHDER